MIDTFTFAATPHIHFGPGSRHKLADVVTSFGSKLLLVTGAASFDASNRCRALLEMLESQFEVRRVKVTGEPSPAFVDRVVRENSGWGTAVVVAIGGGSAVDAAKAIAGLLPSGDSVMEYLEGVGRGKPFDVPTTPFVALPTTAGTGGETSKNAVLSEIGSDGFKKSFRDERLVARHIILDPELTFGCSPATTAACGLDAFTQLLESYLSTAASPMTDALALRGMAAVRESLLPAFRNGSDIDARSGMLFASSISGLTLANAGLGSVHGLASPLGAFFPMPHGQVCGALLYDAVRINIDAMLQREPESRGLIRYAEVGRLMGGDPHLDDDAARDSLLRMLDAWRREMTVATLADYGVTEADFDRIITHISGGSMRTNPIVLERDEIMSLLRCSL